MINKTIVIPFLTLAVISIATQGVNAENINSDSRKNRISQNKNLDLACMKTAVEKREIAIQTAWDKFSVSVKSALETRKSELSTTWSITDKSERKKAIDAVWKKFKTSRSAARKTLNKERLTTWEQFRTDRAKCGSGPTGENPETDIQL